MASISTRNSGFAKEGTLTHGDGRGIRPPHRERGSEPGVHVRPLDDVDVQLGDVRLRHSGLGEHGEDVAQCLLGLVLDSA